jgi:hypothetical protein
MRRSARLDRVAIPVVLHHRSVIAVCPAASAGERTRGFGTVAGGLVAAFRSERRLRSAGCIWKRDTSSAGATVAFVLTICASAPATGSILVAGQTFSLASPCGVETFLRAGTVVERTVDSWKS